MGGRCNRTAPTGMSVAMPPPASSTKSGKSMVSVPKGLIPTLIYSLFFITFPLVSYYETMDFTATEERVGVILCSVGAAAFIVLANDCVTWFNMALFFHLGVEITVLDTLIDYADATSGDAETALAWTAAAIIVLHLVPFFTLDHSGLLTLLAAAGVVVNASALVFVDSDMLLLTGFSASVLLAAVLLIACIDCVHTSLLSQLRQAVKEGTWLVCSKFEH
jgi:hypothetical protein